MLVGTGLHPTGDKVLYRALTRPATATAASTNPIAVGEPMEHTGSAQQGTPLPQQVERHDRRRGPDRPQQRG